MLEVEFNVKNIPMSVSYSIKLISSFLCNFVQVDLFELHAEAKLS